MSLYNFYSYQSKAKHNRYLLYYLHSHIFLVTYLNLVIQDFPSSKGIYPIPVQDSTLESKSNSSSTINIIVIINVYIRDEPFLQITNIYKTIISEQAFYICQ
jgi:hypothetical protein